MLAHGGNNQVQVPHCLWARRFDPGGAWRAQLAEYNAPRVMFRTYCAMRYFRSMRFASPPKYTLDFKYHQSQKFHDITGNRRGLIIWKNRLITLSKISSGHFFFNHFFHATIFLVFFCNICNIYPLGLVIIGLEVYKENFFMLENCLRRKWLDGNPVYHTWNVFERTVALHPVWKPFQ